MSLDWLDHDLTTRAYLWKLDRDDGVSLGFVSHDHDLIVDGFRYRASPGMIPSTIAMSDSLDVDNMEVEGVVSHDAISDDDLTAGRWSGARLQISLVDWRHPDAQLLPLIAGEFGEIMRSDAAFRVEIWGLRLFWMKRLRH